VPNTLSGEINLKTFRESINQHLALFSQEQTAHISPIGSELHPSLDALSRFVTENGKRFRPLFALLGVAATGAAIEEKHIKASLALEYLHVCALIHDDLMDGSDSRRGAPSIHKHFESIHRSEKLEGNAEQYGLSAAVLIGDLALVLSDKALNTSGMSSQDLANVYPIFDEMRIELMAGQFLDIHEQTLKHRSAERALRIATYKSGKYSIERPLHFGASLIKSGIALEHINSVFSDYGIPLGQAFQLRDDLLGVFGESAVTGKPAGDDLREGKRTLLIAQTFELLEKSDKTVEAKYLDDRLGTAVSEEETNRMREIISDCGARDSVETTIANLCERAEAALASDLLSAHSIPALREMISIVSVRNA
jgi:geranylgeranyl diphosphate synthase type I